jgi:HD-GYP domain-containing protein (c-di-GMP phosphodiesterase class II)
MERRLKLYVFGVIGAGAAAELLELLTTPAAVSGHDALIGVLLVGLSVLTYLAPVKLAPKRQVVLYTSLQMGAILVLTPGVAAALCALAVVLGNVYLRRRWFNVLFNAAQVALSVLAAGTVYRLIAPSSLAESGTSFRSVLALLPAGAVLYLVSALAVDGAAALQHRRSPFANWLAVRGPTVVPHVVLVSIGAATAPAINHLPWLMFLAVAPVIAVRSIVRQTLRFDAETVRIGEAIADAVDGRHPSLVGRSRQVSELAVRVARICKLSEEECQRVYLAARLHDVAAALVPEHAVLDTEVVDQEQRGYRGTHAEASAAYVGTVLSLPSVADILRFHHERFDGRGDPHGLTGVDIPLESRIIALADAWVALTSDRGYRPALSTQQALAVLHAGAGTKWDPKVVESLTSAVQGSVHAPVENVPAAALAPACATGAA